MKSGVDYSKQEGTENQRNSQINVYINTDTYMDNKNT